MKAYIGWPVKLKGNLVTDDAHITLKYLGEIDRLGSRWRLASSGYDPLSNLIHELEQRLAEAPQLTFPMDDGAGKIRWVPEKFSAQVHVMAIEDFDPFLKITHEKVASLREDDYPNWRPHVTMPRSIWAFIASGVLTPEQCIESIGPLTLFVKNDGEDYRPVQVFT